MFIIICIAGKKKEEKTTTNYNNYLTVLAYNSILKILLTGTIWKCFIFNPWLNDNTNVLGLLWLSRTKNTLKEIENFHIKVTLESFGNTQLKLLYI